MEFKLSVDPFDLIKLSMTLNNELKAEISVIDDYIRKENSK